MTVFSELLKWLDQLFPDTSLGVNLKAGLLILIVDFVVTVIGVGLFTSWLERRRWKKSRQMLAIVLLRSMGDAKIGVMKHTRTRFFDKGGKILINAEIELHLARLELSLGNINEQILVHLPAALPPTTEMLSNMTRDVSILRQHVLAMRLYLSKLDRKVQDYTTSGPDHIFIGPEHFNYSEYEENGPRLRDHGERSHKNYFSMDALQISRLTRILAQSVECFFKLYQGNLKRLPDDEWEDVRKDRSYIGHAKEKLYIEESKIKKSGIHLIRYTPTDLELDGDEILHLRQPDDEHETGAK